MIVKRKRILVGYMPGGSYSYFNISMWAQFGVCEQLDRFKRSVERVFYFGCWISFEGRISDKSVVNEIYN